MSYSRFLRRSIETALADTPVVVIQGPRQSGKTTLARSLVDSGWTYRTLDDATTLAAARDDPEGFVRGLDRAAIDEIQRAPGLMLAIKRAVDMDRRPGRFLLTGSANLMTLMEPLRSGLSSPKTRAKPLRMPLLADSLAGRMEVATLLPLAQAEILGREPSFLAGLFAGRLPTAVTPVVGEHLTTMVLRGGYPEAVLRPDESRRRAWLRAYVDALMRRDVRDVAPIERLDRLMRLLQLLAAHSSQLVNFAAIGGQIELDAKTVQKYTAALESLFLVRRLPPWHRNAVSRLVKTPKLHFLDAGLLAALRGLGAERLRANRQALGALLETFVFAELLKAASWQPDGLAFSHFRNKSGHEVDIVVEDEAGAVVGIEVKASATVTAADFRGLKELASLTGDDFRYGVVLYDGEQMVGFGERLAAVPIAALWAS
jgi:predicted AAA+ superfamily ATPase